MRFVFRAFLVLCVILVAGAYAFSHPLHDFLEYWTAAHLLIDRHNPYSLGEMFQAQQSLGWTESVPLMVLNPPWTLPLFAPLGLLKSFEAGWLTWIVVLTGAIALSSRLMLQRYSNGAEVLGARSSWSLLAFTFYPALLSLKFAQVAPLVLLGLAGFLWFEHRNQPFLAGATLALTAIKPQLVFLVWLALVLHVLRSRKRSALAGSATVLVLLTSVALLMDHNVLREFCDLSTSPYVQLYPSALGALLRWPLGVRNIFLLQFVPTIAGIAWFIRYWVRHGREWNWSERMPALVTASVLTAPYGWIFDQVVLALPIAVLAAYYVRGSRRIPNYVLALYTAANAALIFAAILQSPLAYGLAPVWHFMSARLEGGAPCLRHSATM